LAAVALRQAQVQHLLLIQIVLLAAAIALQTLMEMAVQVAAVMLPMHQDQGIFHLHPQAKAIMAALLLKFILGVVRIYTMAVAVAVLMRLEPTQAVALVAMAVLEQLG
jgi:hypothetical protein